MASGRVLIVHESGPTRSLLAELLGKEGYRVAVAESTYACMARFVDEPADLVVIGLAGLAETELGLVAALKAEERPPRILLLFPSPQRELAVRALAMGADGYALEPFYGDEIVGVVKGLLAAPREEADPQGAVARLAREVAHAVNNPLQVLELLLAKDKVTKRELMKGVPEQAERVRAVVAHLREFGAIGEAHPTDQDPRPVLEACPFLVEAEELPRARIDAQQLALALGALHEAIASRAGKALAAQAVVEERALALRCAVPREAFAEEDPIALLDEIFVVGLDREVRPGLLRARRLLESMHGSLGVEQRGDQLVFVARVGR